MPEKSTAPLTPAMLELIKCSGGPGNVLKAGPTRAALIRRGLVHRMDAPITAGTLTEAGVQVWAKANPAPVPVEPELEIVDPLETPRPKTPAQRTADEGDRNAKVRRENESAEIMHSMCTVDSHDGCISLGDFGPEQALQRRDVLLGADVTWQDNGTVMVENLPQRTPGKALTEELTGEVFAPVSASADLEELGVTEGTPKDVSAVVVEHSGRTGHVAQVLLREVQDSPGGIYDRMSREIFIAAGSAWGALMGRQVRIAAEHGDVIHKRRLTIVPAAPGIVLWTNDGDRSVSAGSLRRGDTILIDGVRVYQVQIEAPGMTAVYLRCLS